MQLNLIRAASRSKKQKKEGTVFNIGENISLLSRYVSLILSIFLRKISLFLYISGMQVRKIIENSALLDKKWVSQAIQLKKTIFLIKVIIIIYYAHSIESTKPPVNARDLHEC